MGDDMDEAAEDLERLKRDREELERRVEELENRPERRRHARRIVSTILVVVSVLLFGVAVPGTWARRTLLDTNRYVATVTPIASDGAVQEYLARTVTQQVFDALDVEERLSVVLNERDPRLAFLAGPISNGVRGFVQDKLQAFLASDAFATYWEQANRFVHAQLIAALEGGGTTLAVENGKVVLNLLPLVNQGLQSISTIVSDLVGHPVTLPELSGDEVPSEAISRVESALGIDLPDQFGTIVVYDSQDLAAVQDGVDLASRAIVALVLLFLVLAGIALWVSPRKRRTLVQLSAALAVILVIERRVAIAQGDALVDQAKPENQAAARAVIDQLLGSLLRYTGWLLAIAFVLLVVALVTGPYPWAVRLRDWAADLGGAASGTVRGREVGGAAAWVASHRDAMMLGGAAVATLLLLLIDLSLVGLLVLAIALVAYELLVYRLGAATPSIDAGDDDLHVDPTEGAGTT
jgi:hypothetical protein